MLEVLCKTRFAREWNGQVMLQHPDVACVLGTPDGIVILSANRAA